MKYSLLVRTDALVLCIFLCLGMIVMFIIGRSIKKYFRFEEDEPKGSIGMIQTGLFGLFGFILAFTFGMSGTRFDNLRGLLIDESNTIGTAILRSDLYSDSVRKEFRNQFREYLDGRINAYTKFRDTAFTLAIKNKTDAAASRLWSLAMSESKLPNMLVPSNQMVPALNQMFDAAASRDTLLRSNTPEAIIFMLLVLALVSSFIAGVTSGPIGRREWMIISCFFLFNAMIVYITLDLGRPLRGIIKTRAAEKSFIDLRMMLKD